MLPGIGIERVLSSAGRTRHQAHRRLLIAGKCSEAIRAVVVDQKAECILAPDAAAGVENAPIARRQEKTSAAWDCELSGRRQQGQPSLGVPHVVYILHGAERQRGSDSGLIGIGRIADRVSAPGAKSLAAHLLRRRVRNRGKITTPQQASGNSILPVNDWDYLAVGAGLHAERVEKVGF